MTFRTDESLVLENYNKSTDKGIELQKSSQKGTEGGGECTV